MLKKKIVLTTKRITRGLVKKKNYTLKPTAEIIQIKIGKND